EELVLGVGLAATAVLGDEVGVRELALRIVVAPAVPGVTGDGVEEPPVLLGVLAVVALVPRQPEDPLLENRIAAVPERERETEPLLDVGEASDAVLSPAVRARASMVVRQVLPGGAVRAVVLADGPPLPFAQIRAPGVPVAGLAQTVLGMPEGPHPIPL